MVAQLLMLLIPVILQYTSAHSITDGTRLVFTYIVNRHGDRSPVEESLKNVQKSVDMDLVKKKVATYGYGQLTEKGKTRAYELGKFLRSRYDGFISQTYYPSEIYVRAAKNARNKETLRIQMADLYPLQSTVFNNTVIRQPVPDEIINATYLTLDFAENCQSFTKYFYKCKTASYPSISEQYPALLEQLTDLTGYNATGRPVLTYSMYDGYTSLLNIGYNLKPEIETLLPELKKTAGDAIEVIMSQHEYIPLEAGVLLTDFFDTATKVYNQTSTEKMRLYSAHDVNVYAMQVVSQVGQAQGHPDYCSLFALELRRVIKTGKWVVLPVYLPTPGKPVVYLKVRGCGGYLCDYDTFEGITKGASITQQQYDSRCQANCTKSG